MIQKNDFQLLCWPGMRQMLSNENLLSYKGDGFTLKVGQECKEIKKKKLLKRSL